MATVATAESGQDIAQGGDIPIAGKGMLALLTPVVCGQGPLPSKKYSDRDLSATRKPPCPRYRPFPWNRRANLLIEQVYSGEGSTKTLPKIEPV